MTKAFLLSATALTALFLDASTSYATTNRAWVSGHGTDAAGCGAPSAPCRSFQYVLDNIVAPGGEIDVLDPAGYGAFVVSHAVSIVNDGVGTAGVQSTSGNAITINAGPADAVHLRGLNVDGLGAGANGVVFNSGGSLAVVDCVVRQFAGSGTSGNAILIQPTAAMTFLISNTIVADNASTGIVYNGSAAVAGVISKVTAVNNANGIVLQSNSANPAKIQITTSVVSNNTNNGVSVSNSGSGSGALTTTIDFSTISDNGNDGIIANGQELDPTKVYLGRSEITGNATGVVDNTFGPNSFFTYGDNRINGNTTDISGSLVPGTQQ